jgi:uncharacterized protein YndB with AHSA1/START domain
MKSPKVSYRIPVSAIFEVLVNCDKYQLWWPKTYTTKFESCPAERIGTRLAYSSDMGNYTTTLRKIEQDQSTLITYEGIFKGFTKWTVQKLDENTTRVCYNSFLIPNTTSLKLFTKFITEDYAKSFFTPLFDSLDNHIKTADEFEQFRTQKP